MPTPTARPFHIEPTPGFTPMIGHLVAMLEDARGTLLQAVDGLTQPALDFLLDEHANTIGALLDHVASVEEAFQEYTFGEAFEPRSSDRRMIAGRLGDEARTIIRGHDLAHYTDRLAAVRAFTLAELAKRDDDWLYDEVRLRNDRVANHFWCWYHAMEDELNHRGQIRLVRKRLP
jgi:uncharacterized damage-inducible protein DinB